MKCKCKKEMILDMVDEEETFYTCECGRECILNTVGMLWINNGELEEYVEFADEYVYIN